MAAARNDSERRDIPQNLIHTQSIPIRWFWRFRGNFGYIPLSSYFENHAGRFMSAATKGIISYQLH